MTTLSLSLTVNRGALCAHTQGRETVGDEPKPSQSTNPLQVTLQDVAALAGVSIKTVSRVVNHQGEMRESTRQRVQQAIDQLGYRPNVLARSLVMQRTNTLAVVAWGIEFYGPLRTVVGIEEQAHELGYSLQLRLLSRPDDADRERVLDELLAHRVEGIIWAVPEMGLSHAWLDESRVSQLPPLVFLSMAARPGMAVVAVDNRAGGCQAARHLVAQGCRRIGIITGPLDWWEARERHLGWRAALEEAGLDTPDHHVAHSDWSSAGGERAMRQLLDQAPELDAVFASSDQIALGALGVLHQSGRRVPHDLALSGFDNTPESAFYWPPLTTIHQHLTQVGRVAVQNLHEIIEIRRDERAMDEPRMVLLEPELVIRSSTLRGSSG